MNRFSFKLEKLASKANLASGMDLDVWPEEFLEEVQDLATLADEIEKESKCRLT